MILHMSGAAWTGTIYVVVDLFNREIIGYSAGCNKTANLVKQAYQSVKENLKDIQIFHTVRSNELKNHTIDETLKVFEIQRSLSHKGCPYDNAVAEATFKIIKPEFVRNQIFCSVYHLQMELADYVNWFNNHRIYSSLGYLTPVKYRILTPKKLSRKLLTIYHKFKKYRAMWFLHDRI